MKNKVILVTTDRMGTGEAELGETVMETFFTLLKQREDLPRAVFLMNRGTFLLTEQSFVAPHLKELSEKGTPVLACKTCVDYYKLEDKMIAGEISGMNVFIELAAQYEVMTIA